MIGSNPMEPFSAAQNKEVRFYISCFKDNSSISRIVRKNDSSN